MNCSCARFGLLCPRTVEISAANGPLICFMCMGSLGRIMEISLHRSRGFLRNAIGRALPLSLFFNGKRIGSIKTGETKSFNLPDYEGVLQVGFTKTDEGFESAMENRAQDVSRCAISSPGFGLSPADQGARLEVVTSPWAVLNVFDLSSISPFSRLVFRICRRQD